MHKEEDRELYQWDDEYFRERKKRPKDDDGCNICEMYLRKFGKEFGK